MTRKGTCLPGTRKYLSIELNTRKSVQSSSGKYLIWDTNSLFCPALSSVHETFPTFSLCHTLFAPKVVCPKSVNKLYQEREKVPSLENASTTPMTRPTDGIMMFVWISFQPQHSALKTFLFLKTTMSDFLLIGLLVFPFDIKQITVKNRDQNIFMVTFFVCYIQSKLFYLYPFTTRSFKPLKS